jgi:tRNA threonylcarbamoyl adenosine modification protein (Sua5/YciO/YrdC/YwlC family)
VARYFDVHPENPQARLVTQIVDLLRQGRVIAYPTDLAYALGCRIGDSEALDRIREIRQLDAKHHFTLMCNDFSQASQFVTTSNSAFRAIRATTPGPYTFVLPATRDVPRRLQHPKKQTVGIRIPRSPVVQAILAELGEPLVSTTLLLPGDDGPLTQGWDIKERLDHLVDAVVDAGEGGTELTTLVDLSEGEPEVVRVGAGDPSRFT